MKYRVVTYMRIEPEEEELLDTYEDALREKENLEGMEWPHEMNIFKIEEVAVLNVLPKKRR